MTTKEKVTKIVDVGAYLVTRRDHDVRFPRLRSSTAHPRAREWRPSAATTMQNRKRVLLFFPRIVSGVDVVDASGAGELNLENRLLVSGPSIMWVFCRVHP